MKSPPGLVEDWVSNLNVDFTCFKVPAAPCPPPRLPGPLGAPRAGAAGRKEAVNSSVRRAPDPAPMGAPGGCRGGFVSPCSGDDDVSELQTTGKGKVLGFGAFLLACLLSSFSLIRWLSVSRAVNCLGQGLHLEIMSWE